MKEKSKKNLKLSTQFTLEKHNMKKSVNLKQVSSVTGSIPINTKNKFEINIGTSSNTP